MTMLSGIGLFKGIMAKMDWLDQNQRIISQNVANSDTPGYQPMTLKDMDFKSMMGSVANDGAGASGGMPKLSMTPVSLQATNPMHFGTQSGETVAAKENKQKTTYEASPDNNGVVLEEQLFKANKNSTDYQRAADLYRRNVGMLRMALGKD